MRTLLAAISLLFAACGARELPGGESCAGFPSTVPTFVTEYVRDVPDRGANPTARLVSLGPHEDRASRAQRLSAALPTITGDLRVALERQRALLKRQNPRKTYELNGRLLTPRDFIRVIDALLSGRYLSSPLGAVPVSRGGSVHFTGYYSPEIDVRRDSSASFPYPILRRPDHLAGAWPTRKQIEQENAIDAAEHAIAWASHPLDVYTLQLQGSGFVRFGDGARRYLAYGGTNRYPYQSIELAVQRATDEEVDVSLRGLRDWIDEDPGTRDTVTAFNPNYGFFRLDDGEARGAAGVPLTPMISVAADPKHYPLGSVLLARVPMPAARGSYRTQLLLVQDTGGAIRGRGRLDLYTGVGERALDVAEVTSATGEVYMLSPN